MRSPVTISAEDAAIQLKTSLASGLTFDEALARINQFGSNTISKHDQTPWWKVLTNQFTSPIVYLLMFAAIMSFYFSEWLDGVAILIVILVNALIGFYMEFQAGRSMQALQKLASVSTRVLRGGKLTETDAEGLVPGDVIYLEAGDMVSADARITKPRHLQVNESSLTGESAPVLKDDKQLSESTPLADQSNMVFKGTFVTNGNSWAVVTATGMETELGKIAKLVRSAEQSVTPLEKKLEQFSKKLIKVTVGLVILIFFSGWFFGHELVEMINTSIALAVAAIPEGLPIVATLGLARGMIRMARHQVIVKKLSAVETLGGTTIICTDKTGTLTENRMTVKSVVPATTSEQLSKQIIQCCILCNTAELGDDGKEIGDPLETALLKHASQYESVKETRIRFPKVNEEPFSSETKRMITVHQHESGCYAFAKGAVEEILRISSSANGDVLTHSRKKEYLQQAGELASKGYKVIALAARLQETNSDVPINDFDFLGLLGLIDPPRPEVKAAISECKSAGINVVMVTGDHPNTAKEIGRQLGLIDSPDEHALVGADMKAFNDLTTQDKKHWLSTHIFARVTPSQKLDLISVYQQGGAVVGMTGDGVNDAPALKKADIGIAMGLRGTQVAQDVADMVLKDDSFTSIVSAIRQGRIIFDNIRKFVIFLLSCNLSELFTIAITAVLNLHFQLFPLQILFINLITDVLPALALGMTPGNPNIMKQKPRSINEPIISSSKWRSIIAYSIIISAGSLGAVLYSHYSLHSSEGWNPALCNNILFFTLILSQLLHVFNMGESGTSFFKSEVVRNKFVWYSLVINLSILFFLYEITTVREVLSINTLSISDWLVVVGFSLATLVINRLTRLFHVKNNAT